MAGGWNPLTGRDSTGGCPPFAPYGAPVPSPGQPYVHHSGGPGYNYGSPVGQGPAGGFYTQQSFSYQPNGTGNVLPRLPQPWPVIDPTMPAAQMTNSSGGMGCEPGYNYFFPSEHTKAHVFRSNVPPWQLPSATQLPFKAAHIPCNTTFADLLKGFGCSNPVAKKNRVVEIINGGGGKWYKGLEVGGGDKEGLKKTIGEVGWDSTRTGLDGQKPVVCLWFCKD
ncbi:hypothetical protein CDD81_6681 [Ophiocordyceps australis]|uniref:Uncharacterized protein n=1 Tax=Ophiocordyceps australis TaxID=1399860 RepID=A0A2C5X9C0_9HYPO|nr:hypothetical protein CDD81_6681 [Ophiocordyceps australis]